jgi:hypothetical protein
MVKVLGDAVVSEARFSMLGEEGNFRPDSRLCKVAVTVTDCVIEACVVSCILEMNVIVCSKEVGVETHATRLA